MLHVVVPAGNPSAAAVFVSALPRESCVYGNICLYLITGLSQWDAIGNMTVVLQNCDTNGEGGVGSVTAALLSSTDAAAE